MGGKCIRWGKAESLDDRYCFSYLQQFCEACTVIIYILQLRQLRHREAKSTCPWSHILRDEPQMEARSV